jgi:hypothetical protein
MLRINGQVRGFRLNCGKLFAEYYNSRTENGVHDFTVRWDTYGTTSKWKWKVKFNG